MAFVCPVCLAEDEIPRNERVRAAECEHWVHRKCMASWLGVRHVCPACNAPTHATVSFVDRQLVPLVSLPTLRIRRSPMITLLGGIILVAMCLSFAYAFVLSMARDDVIVIFVDAHFPVAMYMVCVSGLAFVALHIVMWPY